jgi:hypothetical protein
MQSLNHATVILTLTPSTAKGKRKDLRFGMLDQCDELRTPRTKSVGCFK